MKKTIEIKVGDHVRSYDFPDIPGMKTTCFVEGVVEAIGQVPGIGGCDRYTIRITRRVWQGKEDDKWRTGKEFPTGRCYPPVNGLPSWLGGVTDHVKLLPPEPQPKDAITEQLTKKQAKALEFVADAGRQGWEPAPGTWPCWLSPQTLHSLIRRRFVTDITGRAAATEKGRRWLDQNVGPLDPETERNEQ
jgi:hypothetical protein